MARLRLNTGSDGSVVADQGAGKRVEKMAYGGKYKEDLSELTLTCDYFLLVYFEEVMIDLKIYLETCRPLEAKRANAHKAGPSPLFLS